MPRVKAAPKKRRLLCSQCGKRRESTRRRVDPYMEEIMGKRVILQMCDDCTYERARDV